MNDFLQRFRQYEGQEQYELFQEETKRKISPLLVPIAVVVAVSVALFWPYFPF